MHMPKWVQELSAKNCDMARALSCRPWLGQAKWCSGRRKPNWHVVSLPPWVGGPVTRQLQLTEQTTRSRAVTTDGPKAT